MKIRVVALFVVGAMTALAAQTPAIKPVFDVASIRVNTAPDNTSGIGDQPGGRFVASRVTLRRVIQFAYRGNQDFIGGPDWLDTERWDIEAKAPEGAVPRRASPLDVTRPDTLALMVQSLLEDRFKLTSHQDTRVLSLYNLTVAKGGAKIKLSEDQTPPAAIIASGNGAQGIGPGGIRLGRNNLEARAQSIDLFAAALGALYVDHPVVDKTGLKGLFDIRLQWTPGAGPDSLVAPGTVQTTPAGTSIFNALEEQLGLKLEAGKGPLPVLVIDSIQRPSEN